MTIITDKITELTTFINNLPAGDPRADDAAKTLAIWQEAAATSGGGGGDASAANQVVQQDLTGLKTETAPAGDTASSGLNGRLQRIAQRVTTLIGLLPNSLGQKNKDASLAVTFASDQDALPLIASSVVYTETLLTAPGSTTTRPLSGGYTKAFVSYTVANINTNVVIRIEGSNDGSNWINLDPNGDKTITTNVTDFYQLIDVVPLNIRFTFVSESGGTAATIQVITRLSS